MPYTLADLKQTPGTRNMGGLLSKAYYVLQDDLDLTTPLTLSASGALNFAGPILLKAGKDYIEIYATPEKNSLLDNSVGEVDGMSKENIYEFVFPGSRKDVDEFEAYALNTPALILVPDTSGNMRVLGMMALDPSTTAITVDVAAHLIQANGTSGAARADLRGKTFQFKHSAPHAPLYYTGPLPAPAP
jgi:hypothetical protein